MTKSSNPWERTNPGQGFFVPCLDTTKVREQGLKLAMRSRVKKAEATIGIRGGLYGVWFFRKR